MSPELVLVDPVLAAAERSLLPDVSSFGESVRVPLAPWFDEQGSTVLAAPALDRHARHGRPSWRRPSWPRVAGVAAATVLALALLDARVDLGRTPATAENTDLPPRLGASAQVAPRPATKARTGRQAAAPGRAKQKQDPATAPTRQQPARATGARRFAWAPVAGADSYLVELYRREARVFTATSTRPEINVPASWHYDGSRRSLAPGEYRWYVWAIDSGKRASTAVVQATVTVS